MVSNRDSSKGLQGYVLIAFVSILWGTMGILQKYSFAYGILPATLISLRLLITSTTLMFFLALFRRGSLRIHKLDLLPFLVFGVFAVAVQRVSYAYAVYLTTATMAAILFYTYPVFVTILASLLFKEKITWRVWSAIALTFLGVAFVVKAYDVSTLSIDLPGIVFGIASSICFVLYFILVKRFRSRYTNWTLTLYGDSIGALALIPFVFVSIPEIMIFPFQLWLLILAIAWILSLIAYLVYSYALKYVKASKGSILSVIEPISAALFSTLLLGERLEVLQIVGIALALAGLILLFLVRKADN